jgi:hypothetical protein
MNDILIATILPNGIDRTTGNYQFSLCLDLNYRLNLENYTDSQLLDVTNLLLKAIDDMIEHGFEIQIIGKVGPLKVKSTDIQFQFQGEKSDAAAIRKEIWKRLFDYHPATDLFSDLASAKSIQYSSENLIGTSLLKDPLQKIHQTKVLKVFGNSSSQENERSVLQEAEELMKDYDDAVGDLFERLKGIRTYSELKTAQQSEAYFERKLNSQFGNSSGTDNKFNSANFISKDKIFDTISLLSENNIYQRLAGFVIDFKIDAVIDETEFQVQFKAPKDIVGIKAISWVTPLSSIVVYEVNIGGGSKKAVLLEGNSNICSGIYSSSQLELVNHDKLAKLASLKRIFDEIKAAGGGNRSQNKEQELIDAIKKIDTSTLTNGLNVYHGEWKQQVEEGALINGIEAISLNSSMLLKEQNFIKGHRFGVGQNDQYSSLGRRRCDIFWKNGNKIVKLLDSPIQMDFSVNTDTGMASLDEVTGNISALIDETLLNWSGENLAFPTIFAKKEDEENFEPTNDEGSISDSMQVSLERLRTVFDEQQFPFNTSIKKAKLSFDGKKVSYASLKEEQLITLKFTPLPKSTPRLIFGKSYDLIIVHEYKNGWAIPFEDDNPHQINVSEFVQYTKTVCSFSTPRFTFLRNEPVRPIAVFLREPLFNTERTAQIPGKEGESLHHLVIRNQGTTITNQKTFRHLLPPQISFQHAFWHGEIFKMTPMESFNWYKKYMSSQGIQMPDYISADTAFPNYIPDPLCNGFRIRFFLDKDLAHPAMGYNDPGKSYVEFLFNKANYPRVPGCLLLLEDDRENLNKVFKTSSSITLRLAKGEELFAEIRTVMAEAYERQLEIFGGKSPAIRDGLNNFITPPLMLQLTHATKRPIISPEITDINAVERRINTSFLKFNANIHFEQLNLYKGIDGKHKYMNGSLPTGDMELYAKWEEYIDDADQIFSDHYQPSWTPEQPVIPLNLLKYVLETHININDQLNEMSENLSRKLNSTNEAKNYATPITIEYDLHSTKYLEKHFIIKNKSSYSAYYPSGTDVMDFARMSEETGYTLTILNNKKPVKPSVNRIVPLLVTNEHKRNDLIIRESFGNRFRIYLNRGRLTSGNLERLGVLVYDNNSSYNKHFIETDQLSTTGRDVTADELKPIVDNRANKRIFLYKANLYAKDPSGLVHESTVVANDLAQFKQEYVDSLGCWTYLPKFNREENLWYVDIEVDIDGPESNSLHTPFFQLAFVHYQERSIYAANNLEKDYRISEVEKSPFLYLLPRRKVSLQALSDRVKIGITPDKESLLASATSHKSAFIGAVQFSNDDVVWEIAGRLDGKESFLKLDIATGSINEIEFVRKSNQDYRVLLLELEVFDFTQFDAALRFNDIVEAKSARIIMINTFKI